MTLQVWNAPATENIVWRWRWRWLYQNTEFRNAQLRGGVDYTHTFLVQATTFVHGIIGDIPGMRLDQHSSLVLLAERAMQSSAPDFIVGIMPNRFSEHTHLGATVLFERCLEAP